MKKPLSDWQREKLVALYDLFDNDGDGTIDETEFEGLLERIRVDTGWPEESRVMSHVAARWRLFLRALFGNSPHLSETRWLDHFSRFLIADREARVEDTAYRGPVEEMAHLLFMMLDRDRNGEIEPEEFLIFFYAIGRNDADAEASFAKLDQNQDGLLQREEVEDMALEFFHSIEPGSSGDWLFGPPPASKANSK